LGQVRLKGHEGNAGIPGLKGKLGVSKNGLQELMQSTEVKKRDGPVELGTAREVLCKG